LRGAEHVTRIEEMRNAIKIFVGKPEEKRMSVRPSVGDKITLK
jgi:hypothetical protein